jgi:anti-sigma regulatory factor (Ser/Thr protein kinase)
MKEIALHILDITQNSISAGASCVDIEILEAPDKDELIVVIDDNGRGMTREMVDKVSDPYFTSRTTRKVGMGIPLFKHNAEQAGGSLEITSEPGIGTRLTAKFCRSHMDCPPIGDIAGVISMLAGANPGLDFRFTHRTVKSSYVFDTREVKEVLEEVPLSEPAVIRYMKEMISENLTDLSDTP